MRYNFIYLAIQSYINSKIPNYGDLRDIAKVSLICDCMDLALQYEHMQGRLLDYQTYGDVTNGNDSI